MQAKQPAIVSVVTDQPPFDGEQLGSFVFDLTNVKAGHSGLWVFPAGYSDAALCQGRADHLTESLGVRFHAVPLLRIGDETEWYAATGVSSTAELRRIVRRAMDRARGMTPLDEAADGEALP